MGGVCVVHKQPLTLSMWKEISTVTPIELQTQRYICCLLQEFYLGNEKKAN